MTVIDSDGRRHSLDVLADSSYDAAHLYYTHAAAHRASGLPIPTAESVFEVTAKGKVHTVNGIKLRDWILKERQQRKGPMGYLFLKRPVMD